MSSSVPGPGSGWKEFPKGVPCVICGHAGWCTVAPNGDAIQCRRVESKHPILNKDGTIGWLHPIPDAERPRCASLPPKAKAKKRTESEWKAIVKQQRTALNPQKLRRFAESLG